MLTSPVEVLRQLFLFEERPNLRPRYNVAPTDELPAVKRPRDPLSKAESVVLWELA